MVKEAGLQQQNNDGMIIFADDQFVVRQVMQVYFQELGILDRVLFCKNGDEVVDFFRGFFNELQSNPGNGQNISFRPVTLLLMDINMPFKSGLEANREVLQLFNEF